MEEYKVGGEGRGQLAEVLTQILHSMPTKLREDTEQYHVCPPSASEASLIVLDFS